MFSHTNEIAKSFREIIYNVAQSRIKLCTFGESFIALLAHYCLKKLGKCGYRIPHRFRRKLFCYYLSHWTQESAWMVDSSFFIIHTAKQVWLEKTWIAFSENLCKKLFSLKLRNNIVIHSQFKMQIKLYYSRNCVCEKSMIMLNAEFRLKPWGTITFHIPKLNYLKHLLTSKRKEVVGSYISVSKWDDEMTPSIFQITWRVSILSSAHPTFLALRKELESNFVKIRRHFSSVISMPTYIYRFWHSDSLRCIIHFLSSLIF